MITFENRYVKQLIELADLLVTNVSGDGYIDEQVHAFEDEAKALGYIKLGSGYFSQAWAHPDIKDYAIKLGFKKEDSGALYAAYCRDNQGKAGIPTIYGLDRFKSCYVVLMDKLTSYEKLYTLYHTKKSYYEAADKGKVIKPQAIKDYEHIRSYFSNYRLDNPVNSSIHQTALDIRNFFQGVAAFDLHDGNIMIDKYGQLIITDPVSFIKTCKKEHHELKRQTLKIVPKAVFGGRGFFDDMPQGNPINFDMAMLLHEAPLEWKSCKKRTPKIARGAEGAKKPAFLIAKDARNVIKARK
ncbi:kinase [Vibrio phage D529]